MGVAASEALFVRSQLIQGDAITRKLAALSVCALVCAIKCHSADLLKRALQRLATVLDASKDALAQREHYLAIVDNVLPRLAVERITGRRLIGGRPRARSCDSMCAISIFGD